MRKTFKYRIEVSPAIEEKFERTQDLCRELYNAALAERIDAYKWQRKFINFVDQANQLPEIKKDRPEFKAIHSQVAQDVLKRLQRAFENFFRRIKEGAPEPGFPKFKGKYRYDSFSFPQSGWKLKGNQLSLSKIGTVKVVISRPISGDIKTVTIKREAGNWYACFSCELASQPLPATTKIIGIDVGLEHFLTTNTGRTINNPRQLRNSEKKLAKLQRRLSRKQKRSQNWQRAKAKVTKIHTKIKDQRRDFIHKLSTKIVRNNDIICYENLNIAGMVRNSKLAKSISDAGWAMFFQQLEYKAADAAKLALNVSPNNTSQQCSGCGQKVIKGLSVRWHKCPHCGLVLHRDKNAAKNILARGIDSLLAAGLAVTAPGGLALARLLNGEPSHLESSLVFRRAG